MEETLGAALLVRGRQGVTPTQAGRTLLQHARTMLRQAERLREDLGAYAGGLAGQVRVLCNTNALTEFLPEALSSFLTAHPNVSVDLEERLSDEIVGLIAEGVADLGIVAATVDASALETYPFRTDRFVLVVARDHPLAERASITFAEVLDHDFVGLDRASALQRFLADKANRSGRPLRLRVQLRSFDAVCRLVECNVGIGIVAGTVDTSRLDTFPFRSDRFVLVTSRDHPLARRDHVAFADVLDYDFVGLDRASALQRFLADKASRIGRPLKLRVQLRSFDGVCRLVERNAGIGIVPETTMRWAARSMAIKAVYLTDTWALRDLTICVRDVASLSPFARQLVEHMRAG
jgi:DNA-binding transcriptional LysR family regulator